MLMHFVISTMPIIKAQNTCEFISDVSVNWAETSSSRGPPYSKRRNTAMLCVSKLAHP